LGIQFDNVKAKAKLNDFGFHLIEYFQDNTKIFFSAEGDFLFGYYIDDEDLQRPSAFLDADEFYLFLDYISCLYAILVLKVKGDRINPSEREYLTELIGRCSDNVLKDFAKASSKSIIERKYIELDDSVMDIYRDNKIDDFEHAIYRCQQLKGVLKESKYPILTFGSLYKFPLILFPCCSQGGSFSGG